MIASERLLRFMASSIRGGMTGTEFRVISGRETIPVRTHVSAESTAHVRRLRSNATAIPVFQLKCLMKVNDKIISYFVFIQKKY